MIATDKLAQKRLTLLQPAENLGNVSKARRMHKAPRSQLYEYKRAFQECCAGSRTNSLWKASCPALFNRTFLDDFFRIAFRTKFHESGVAR